MSKFRIEPHGRLQEWVAEEKGYFRDEGLDYEFVNSYVAGESGYAAVQSSETAAPEVKRGAFENMERGRAADVSCACHWAVNGIFFGARPDVGACLLGDAVGYRRCAGVSVQEATRPGQH